MIRISSERPGIETVRGIKRALHDALQLSEDSIITVTELACLVDACAPVETVFGLLRPDAPQLQHRIHKALAAVNAEDLARVCAAWGVDVPAAALASFNKQGEAR